MGTRGVSQITESVIWSRLMRTMDEDMSPETARYLLSIRFSEADHSRLQVLMDKSNEGQLTSDDEAEFDSYLNIADFLTIMHSRARVALRKAGLQPSVEAHDS